MKQIRNKRAFFSIISFLVIGLAAGFLVNYAVYSSMPEYSISTAYAAIIGAIQIGFIYGLCMGSIGYLQARKVGLNKGLFFENSPVNLKAVITSLGLSLVAVSITVAMEKLVFIKAIPQLSVSYSAAATPLSLLASVVYGGLLEEIMLRLCFMTVVCVCFNRAFRKQGGIKPWMFYVAIFISALVFAAGHLPATQATFGLSTMIIVRCMLLNSLAGIICGWLFYKYGLEYAMLCHIFFHLFLNLVFIPIFF